MILDSYFERDDTYMKLYISYQNSPFSSKVNPRSFFSDSLTLVHSRDLKTGIRNNSIVQITFNKMVTMMQEKIQHLNIIYTSKKPTLFFFEEKKYIFFFSNHTPYTY